MSIQQNIRALKAAGMLKSSMKAIERKYPSNYLEVLDETGEILIERGIIAEGLPKGGRKILSRLDDEIEKTGKAIGDFRKEVAEDDLFKVFSPGSVAERIENEVKKPTAQCY